MSHLERGGGGLRESGEREDGALPSDGADWKPSFTKVPLVLFHHVDPERLFVPRGSSEEVGAVVNANVESKIVKFM
jgi:hypothetical protein